MKYLSAPTDIFFSITNRCNMLCLHCSVYPLESPEEEMSTDEIFDLIDELGAIKVFTIRISGGEPFARNDIIPILERIAKNKMRSSINTNATLITEEVVKELKRFHRRIADIMVSVDGANENSHDRMRGPGSFDKMITGVQKLAKAGLNLSAYTTVTRHNYTELEEIIRLCKKLKISHVKFNELLPIGMGARHYRELGLQFNERRNTIKTLKKLKKKYNGFISGTYLEVCELFSSRSRGQGSSFSGCGATLNSLTILSDGSVVPCDRLQGYKLGNVRRSPLLHIWRTSRALKQFRERFTKTLEEIDDCRDCEYKGRCTGGCPAIPYYFSRKLIARDPLSCYRVYSGEEPLEIALRKLKGEKIIDHGVRVKIPIYF